MEENAQPKHVMIQMGIKVGDPIGNLHDADHMLQQSTQIGMMISNARGPSPEIQHEFIIHQVGMGDGLEDAGSLTLRSISRS